MFQNTSSSLPAIYQPAEAAAKQDSRPEEPAWAGDQTGVLPRRSGTQGSHGAGLLSQSTSRQSLPRPQPLSDRQLGAQLQCAGQ